MKNYIPIVSTAFLFICLVSAQQAAEQSAQVGSLVPDTVVCNSTTIKPTPVTKSYILKTCIVAKFAAYLSIGQGKYIELKNGVVNTNISRCEKAATNQTAAVNPMLVVDFECGQLEFEIGRSNGSEIFVKSINGNYNLGPNRQSFANSTQLFATFESGVYYKCNSEQTVHMNGLEVDLVLSNLAYEAYRTATGTDFYRIPEECALDAAHVSDLVRIGVGICLVALVVIVLIAYFVGRRRWSERSSYESV